jgi:hypothetical protein
MYRYLTAPSTETAPQWALGARVVCTDRTTLSRKVVRGVPGDCHV